MGSLYRRPKSKFWWLKYRQNGRTLQESAGTTNKNVAREMLREREGDIAKGVQINLKAKRLTFDDAAKDLINDYTNNSRKSLDCAQRRLDKHLTPFFGGRKLVEITTPLIRAYVAKGRADTMIVRQARTVTQADGSKLEVEAVTKHYSAAEINRELAILKRMFTLAVKAGVLHTRSAIEMLKENNARKSFFEREQFEGVRAHLPAALRQIATFAYLTGWRVRSEILPLEWRQVDFDKQEVRLDPGTTKNGDGRVFPFTRELKTLLEEQRSEHDQLKKTGQISRFVFHRGDGERIKSFRSAWKTACTAAGVPGRLLHDFRRTAVRNLESAGVSRSAAMAMVGHKTQSIYNRYAIVDAVALKEAAAKLDAAGAAETMRRTARRGTR